MIPLIMNNPKVLRIAIVAVCATLLVTLAYLAWVLWQNYWWKQSVNLVADEAGASWAMSSFRRGHLILWEINPTNDSARFSGRRDGPFEIWLDEYHPHMPSPWQYAERRKIEAFNHQMRYMYEHPARFRFGSFTNETPTGESRTTNTVH